MISLTLPTVLELNWKNVAYPVAGQISVAENYEFEARMCVVMTVREQSRLLVTVLYVAFIW